MQVSSYRFLLLLLMVVPYATVAQQRFDIVISEIMADPTPQVGLPNAEFIELKNRSGRSINLQGFRLATPSHSSGAFPNITLAADSFLIVTSTTAAASFSNYGKVIGITSFPSLANEGAIISLQARDGRSIHAVSYTEEWYQNPVKKEGGWSLEMIDINNYCSGASNWKASMDASGGTPGRKNSVEAANPDGEKPQLVNAYVRNKTTVRLIFNEPLDSSSAINMSSYSFHPVLAIQSALLSQPTFSEVELTVQPLDSSLTYRVTATGIRDCAGNEIGSRNQLRIGLPQEVAKGDVIINELLFNPKPEGSDYIELFNRGKKIIDASTLYIANRNNTGAVGTPKKVSEHPYFIFPGDFVVVTEDKASLLKLFLVKNADAVISLPSMPSYPDDKGTVVVLHKGGDIIDEVSYDAQWHFAMITNAEGVALERTDPNAGSQDKNNWHSAASTAGYGTPTYQNSQYRHKEDIQAVVDVRPKVVSPDGDGWDDFALVQYQLAETGFVANVTIFDVAGKAVRHLVKNGTLAQKGSWKWDGLDERGRALPTGHYIIYTELFNLQGKKKQFKNTVVLARKL